MIALDPKFWHSPFKHPGDLSSVATWVHKGAMMHKTRLMALLLTGAGMTVLAGSSAALAEGIETVVVTAEKRQETIQSVPLNVNVVGSDEILRRQVSSLYGLVNAVPSLQVNAAVGGGFAIRGVGTFGFARSAENAVSTVIDGVVVGTAGSNSLYDVDRVEVLAGPQGTLFGKNATAGVLSVVTKVPVFNEFEVSGHLDTGPDRKYLQGQVIANVPLGDDAAMRISYHLNTSGNVYYNAFNKKGDWSAENGVRARLLWQPIENLTINLIAEYNNSRVNGVNYFIGPERQVPAGSALAATLLSACGIVASPTNNRTCVEADILGQPMYRTQNGGISLGVDYDLNGYTLSSISSVRQLLYGDFNYDGLGGDTDSVPTDVFSRNITPSWSRVLSEEIRIVSPTDQFFSWVGGLYVGSTARRDKVDQGLGVASIPGFGYVELRRGVKVDNDNTNYALFGQGEIHATDALSFIVGARLNHDQQRDFSAALFPPFPVAKPPIGVAIDVASFDFQLVNQKLIYDSFSWKVGAQYRVDPETMAYITLSRGFKAGFANDQSTPILASQIVVRPEIPLDLELGVKTTLFDSLALNLAVFHSNIRDFQTTLFAPPTCTGGPGVPAGCASVGTFIQGNAPHIISQGVDISFFGRVFDAVSVNGGLLYLDAHWPKGYLVPCVAGTPAGCTTLAVGQIIGSPKWKATFSGEYSQNVLEGVEGFVQSDFVFTSSFPYSATPDPNTVQGGRFILGARAGFRSEDGSWGVGVFCRNCFDVRTTGLIEADPLSGSNGGNNLSYVQTFYPESFRLVGLSVDLKI